MHTLRTLQRGTKANIAKTRPSIQDLVLAAWNSSKRINHKYSKKKKERKKKSHQEHILILNFRDNEYI